MEVQTELYNLAEKQLRLFHIRTGQPLWEIDATARQNWITFIFPGGIGEGAELKSAGISWNFKIALFDFYLRSAI